MKLLRSALLVVLLSVGAITANGDCTSELQQLVGWTVISATEVDGEFEGCDFDKHIRMTDGSVYTCAEYNYTYSYNPEAIVFGKKVTYQGKSFVNIKILIEDELFEMQPLPLT